MHLFNRDRESAGERERMDGSHRRDPLPASLPLHTWDGLHSYFEKHKIQVRLNSLFGCCACSLAKLGIVKTTVERAFPMSWDTFLQEACWNLRHSLTLFLVEFDTCLVWELMLLPSNAQTAPNLLPLRAPDGDTSEERISAVSMPSIA